MQVGDKVKIVDLGDGSLNGQEGEILAIAEQDPEAETSIPYPYQVGVWMEATDIKVVDGKVYRLQKHSMRDGEFEPVA